ncbi:MAG: PD-(D/E)XK nuclease family protein [Firmicutes bacterium]|uniref:PD-(D/E)XK nuclease family protein n=1 Tax=Candidatus Stercoripulliclostridium pullicola TaxID=2840953 RepID=A0A940ID03_9FIRM|nr:PD-(D/E)XK nuclease family protein [Candidatus Stercoripulliclostridium pullicola]
MEKNESTVELIRAMLGNMPQPNYGSVSEDNIFKILSIENKELFHSKFLKYLIEKNWNSFITFLQSNDILANASGIGKLESIDCEYPYSCSQDCPQQKSGSFDLYIQAQKHTIAIEIKWYAGEQPYQLLRYYKALKKDNTEGTTLIFLTLNGKKGNSVKCDGCFQQCYLTEQNYKCLSFMKISEWINYILSTHPDTLLKQYNEILTEETKNMTIADNILDSIKEADRFAVACALADSMDTVKAKIRNEFFEALRKKLGEKGYTLSATTKNKIYEILPPKEGGNEAPRYLVAYSTNLYCQKDDDWWYIKPVWFDSRMDKRKPDSDTVKGTDEKINLAGLSEATNPVVKWYFMKNNKTKEKTSMIDNVAENILIQLELKK